MLLLYSIIVLGTLIVDSRTNPNPIIIERLPDDFSLPFGEVETNEIPDDFSLPFGEVETNEIPQYLENYKVCQTKECQLTGQRLLTNLNKSVDPCEDFYEYACGGWPANHPMPATETRWDEFSIIQKTTNKRIREILEAPEVDSDILPVKAAKKLYQSCMNLDAIEKSGIKPLEMILEKNGGWPITVKTSQWNRRRISWQKINNNYLRLTGEPILYKITVSRYFKNSNIHVLTLDQPNFILPRSMLVEREQYQEQIAAYAKYMIESALAFAESRLSDVSVKDIGKDVEDMINFEIELAKITPDERKGDTDSVYDRITIHKLQKLYDKELRNSKAKVKINWLKTIQNVFNEARMQVETTEKVLILKNGYILKLVGVLEKTPERTIVNYLHWKFVSSMMPFASEKMRNISFAFVKNLSGITKQEPRWRTCVEQNLLPHAVSYQFVKKYFSEKSKFKVMKIVNQIENEIYMEISSSDWMDDETKAAAKDKLWSMTEFIGFPDWYKNVSAMLHYYKGMVVGPSYFDNIMNYKKFAFKRSLKLLRQPVDKTHWITAPITVNAFYSPSVNSLTFPAAILQVPFFSPYQPNSVNYASIGAVIGHEISHGFDNRGRLFDKNGNAIQWWSDATIKAYNKKAECFVDQFNQFNIKKVEKLNSPIFSNGKLTEGENIADTTGLQAAYQAYQSKLAAEGIADERLPGLEDFNSQQIFFLSFASIWCESVRPEYLLYTVNADVHNTGHIRTIGSVSNIQGFSAAFQCPTGSPMNPEHKRNLWKG